VPHVQCDAVEPELMSKEDVQDQELKDGRNMGGGRDAAVTGRGETEEDCKRTTFRADATGTAPCPAMGEAVAC